jgi:hypothetical protein
MSATQIADVSDFYQTTNLTYWRVQPGATIIGVKGVIGEGETNAVVTAIYVQPRETGSHELSGPITLHVSYCIEFYRIVFV